MKTNKDSIEELIKTLNPNESQCESCKKWFFKGQHNYIFTNCFDVCIECYHRKENEKIHDIINDKTKN